MTARTGRCCCPPVPACQRSRWRALRVDLAVDQTAVDAVEQVELHAKVAHGILIPAGQLVALRFDGEIVDAAEHQILAVGAQAERLDLLEGAAIPLLQVKRVDAQVFIQPLAHRDPLRRIGESFEQPSREVFRHVVHGAVAGLIRIAYPQPDQCQILGEVLVWQIWRSA